MIVSGARNTIDVSKLNEALAGVTSAETRLKRERWIQIYHECRMKETPQKGLSLTTALLVLAHHKLIDENHALK